MRRREFTKVIAVSAAAWPLVAFAQQSERMRRIGVLSAGGLDADDLDLQARVGAFEGGLKQLGWINGQNVRIDIRAGAGDADRTRRYADELAALAPDVILATGAAAVAPLLKAARTVPIVFTNVVDPVGAGFVASLARPGGNVTGFVSFEYGLSAKWLELLREIAPRVTRVAVIRDPEISAGTGQFGAIQAAASSFGLELLAVSPREAGEIEHAIAAFARMPNGGLITTSSALAIVHRDLIIGLPPSISCLRFITGAYFRRPAG
jgi:ABC-type uncharacterized transport system substrate-binding protein